MKHIVVLTGAGISAESGLKTFRDADGLWMGHNIEEVATPAAFRNNPQLVLDFYNQRRVDIINAKPNEAHFGLVKLEDHYKVTIITQNIDDLHERAGSTNVLHLHGEILKMRCSNNPNLVSEIRGDIKMGDLSAEGHQLRPDIVWFNEPVPMIEIAAQIMHTADIFLLIGTSLQVYPAAGLVDYLPNHATKYLIDKKIPAVNSISNFNTIEENATVGINKLLAILL
jgi:NAD-dependent deacetylase